MFPVKRIIGIVACALVIASCYFNWAYYPDIDSHFTGFYSKNNYYGKPGILLTVIASVGILAYILYKTWLNRLNLVLAAVGNGYAFAMFLRYTSGYDGFVPKPQPGIYLMLAGMFIHLVVAALATSSKRVANPVKQGNDA